jgi:hypothetical protein
VSWAIKAQRKQTARFAYDVSFCIGSMCLAHCSTVQLPNLRRCPVPHTPCCTEHFPEKVLANREKHENRPEKYHALFRPFGNFAIGLE